MKILKFILPFLIFCTVACEEKTVDSKLIQIKASFDKFEHFDTIYGWKINRNDSIMFRYDNDNFKESIDTLLFLKNRTQLMGKTLELIQKKEFSIDGRSIEIDKCYYNGDGFHGFNIFYINKEKGIILNTTHSDMIIEYDFVKNKSLIEEIKNDSLFFDYE